MLWTCIDVDEDWLDETLRGLKTILHLTMASGSRRYSHRTEGVSAKLVLAPEHGNVIDVNLLWDDSPKSIRDLPIRHVLPRYPTTENKGDPVLFIRGPRKGLFGIVHNVDDEHVMVSELAKKKGRRAKLPEPAEHSKYDLTTCQWPKKTL